MHGLIPDPEHDPCDQKKINHSRKEVKKKIH